MEKKAEVHALAEELAGLVDPPAEVAQARSLPALLAWPPIQPSDRRLSAQVLGHTALFYRRSPRRLINLET